MHGWIYFCDVSNIILLLFTVLPWIFAVILAFNAFNVNLIVSGNKWCLNQGDLSFPEELFCVEKKPGLHSNWTVRYRVSLSLCWAGHWPCKKEGVFPSDMAVGLCTGKRGWGVFCFEDFHYARYYHRVQNPTLLPTEYEWLGTKLYL